MVTEPQMKSQSEHTSILHMGSMTISTRSSSDRHCHAAVGLPEHYAIHLYILPICGYGPGLEDVSGQVPVRCAYLIKIKSKIDKKIMII